MLSVGKIYKIIKISDPSVVYVGSTFDSLNNRFYHHKTSIKYNKKYSLSGYVQDENDMFISLIKEYEVVREHSKDVKHLRAYEQLWINKLNCVNRKPLLLLKRHCKCGYVARNISKLQRHISQQPASCENQRTIQRNTDIRNNLGINQDDTRCHICDIDLHNKSSLLAHLISAQKQKLHTAILNNKAVKCLICDCWLMDMRGALTVHMCARHKPEQHNKKKFREVLLELILGKNKYDKLVLTRGLKEYCDVCDKYVAKGSLNRHKKSKKHKSNLGS
jgi:hypothetical protein